MAGTTRCQSVIATLARSLLLRVSNSHLPALVRSPPPGAIILHTKILNTRFPYHSVLPYQLRAMHDPSQLAAIREYCMSVDSKRGLHVRVTQLLLQNWLVRGVLRIQTDPTRWQKKRFEVTTRV